MILVIILALICLASIIYFSITKVLPTLLIKKDKKPVDLFSDGLDHPYGLKKINRHHSF